MSAANPPDLKSILLQTISEIATQAARDPGYRSLLQSNNILAESAEKAGIRRQEDLEQALLTQFHNLFRTGHLSWGLNLSNPDPPFLHLTEQGTRALEHLSRDPANPDGYFAHIAVVGLVDSVALAYLTEAVDCYNASLVKAAAVMVGCAAERLIIELRDQTVGQLDSLGNKVPKDMKDWRVTRIATSLHGFFDSKKADFDVRLREEFQAYWTPFTHQFRVSRNDAGHPTSIDPVTEESVHSSLLIFPEYARLQNPLKNWVATELK